MTVTDVNSCTNTSTVNVTVNATPTATAGVVTSPICAGADIELTETGGDATGWSWEGPDGYTSTDQDPTISAATTAASGTYTVTVTDVNSCTNTSTVNVTVNATPTATAGVVTSPICAGADIELTETGGDATGWSWDGPDGYSSIRPGSNDLSSYHSRQWYLYRDGH